MSWKKETNILTIELIKGASGNRCNERNCHMNKGKKIGLSATLAVMTSQVFGVERPNILVIMSDDQGYLDLSCQGAPDFQTPRIDALAASGVRFTDGYVTAPQCGPSRAGLLTGMSQQRFGYINNHAQNGLPPDDVVETIPEQLKRLGYATGIIGKWHIGFRAQENHIHLPGNEPWEQGFDYALVHDSGMSHFYPYRKDGWKWMTERNLDPRLRRKIPTEDEFHFVEGLPEDTYLTDYFSEQAAGFVRQNRSRPWFLFLSYNAPHTPMVAKLEKLPKYAYIQDDLRRRLAAMMDSLDEGVGLVLDELEKTGQTRRTLVFYLSDNGGPTHQSASRNDPFSGRKGDVHEGGIRVPFIAAWPGTIPAGQVLSDPVISLDILPTTLAAAGVETISAVHEGENLLPWLQGAAPYSERPLHWRWCHKMAVRIGTLKETRNGNEVKAVDGTVVPGHVFADLRDNPQELSARELQSPEKRQMLSTAMDAWQQQLEEDQKTLTPAEPPFEPVKHPMPAWKRQADLENEPWQGFSSDKGAWKVRGEFDYVRFEGNAIFLEGMESKQPIAVYRPMDPVYLKEGQTLRIQAEVSATRTGPRRSDVRLGVGYTEHPIKDARKMALRMQGCLFAAASGGAASGIHATRVRDTGNPELFFNSREASQPVGTLPLPESVSTSPKIWSVELTREGDRLLLSSALGGAAAVQPLELGAGLNETDFRFNTLAVAYAYSPGETLTVRQVSVSVSP
jgi:arylsulfatase A-like enzyme